MSDDIIYRLRKRAEIRKSITSKKSVQNNEPDRISDLLEESANKIESLTRDLIGASLYEHDYKTLMAKPPLTDAEIKEVLHTEFNDCYIEDIDLVKFARAILRKAQEK